MQDNWETVLLLPEFAKMLKDQSDSLNNLHDVKVANLEKIIGDLVNNNGGHYIINPNEIAMRQGQITFTAPPDPYGDINNALRNSALRFNPNDKSSSIVNGYKPIYAFDINNTVFSMGMHCGTNPEIAWYYGSEKLSHLTSKGQLFGAVWNDFAEYRKSNEEQPGRVICENGDGTLSLSHKRLQPGAMIISDTFGYAIGETDECKIPVAVAGRVLAYTYEDWWTFEPGEAVCSGPNGTVSKMTRREIKKYPERIIGTVSELPTYEVWGNNIKVDNRIWIKVK